MRFVLSPSSNGHVQARAGHARGASVSQTHHDVIPRCLHRFQREWAQQPPPGQERMGAVHSWALTRLLACGPRSRTTQLAKSPSLPHPPAQGMPPPPTTPPSLQEHKLWGSRERRWGPHRGCNPAVLIKWTKATSSCGRLALLCCGRPALPSFGNLILLCFAKLMLPCFGKLMLLCFAGVLLLWDTAASKVMSLRGMPPHHVPHKIGSYRMDMSEQSWRPPIDRCLCHAPPRTMPTSSRIKLCIRSCFQAAGTNCLIM